KTFRWHGSYLKDLNEAETVEVDLNVLAERAPKIPPNFLDSKYVFLANTHPALQQQMLSLLKQPKLIVADTMNLWITTERVELLAGRVEATAVVWNGRRDVHDFTFLSSRTTRRNARRDRRTVARVQAGDEFLTRSEQKREDHEERKDRKEDRNPF